MMKIRWSPLLATGTRTMVPTLVLFSVFLLVVGHDFPGGGFAGGLIAASALLLVYLSFGTRGLRMVFPFDASATLGMGLGLALLAGIVGLLFAGTFLAYTYATITAPILGQVKISSLLLFDLGVYIVVIGLVATAVLRLGSEPA